MMMDSNSIEETLQYLTQEEEEAAEAAENSNDLLLFMNGFEDQLKEEEDEEKSKTKRTNDDEVKGKRKKVKKQVRFKPETAAQKPVEEGQWLGTDVELALNNWLQQISYVELNLKTTKSLQLGVDESLDRMRKDGPLSFQKLDELKSIGNLWRELIELLSCYNIGIVANKRRRIEILLRLYILKQLSIDVYLNTVMQL
jgi:hypothetical protein